MKRFLVIALVPFVFYACSETDLWDDDVRVEERETRSFSSSRMEKVDVETVNGSIECSVWNDDRIYAKFDKWATGNDIEDAEDNLNDIKVQVIEDTGTGELRIDVKLPTHRMKGAEYGCDVSLNLPASLALDLKSTNGAIEVSESRSDVECFTSNGAITIENTEGDAELRTSNGKITVVNHYGELDGSTSNGAMDIDIMLPRRGECKLKTSNGAIVLSIPRTTSAIIEASTSNGSIEVKDLVDAIIKMDKREFKGRIGDGEGDITLETSNGSILIKPSS